jgi:hypothetical protein
MAGFKIYVTATGTRYFLYGKRKVKIDKHISKKQAMKLFDHLVTLARRKRRKLKRRVKRDKRKGKRKVRKSKRKAKPRNLLAGLTGNEPKPIYVSQPAPSAESEHLQGILKDYQEAFPEHKPFTPRVDEPPRAHNQPIINHYYGALPAIQQDEVQQIEAPEDDEAEPVVPQNQQPPAGLEPVFEHPAEPVQRPQRIPKPEPAPTPAKKPRVPSHIVPPKSPIKHNNPPYVEPKQQPITFGSIKPDKLTPEEEALLQGQKYRSPAKKPAVKKEASKKGVKGRNKPLTGEQYEPIQTRSLDNPPPLDVGSVVAGQGKGDKKEDGLYSDQLEAIMRKHKSFVGVVPKDEVLKLLPVVHKHAKIGFIMNLSNHDAKSGGTHWVAVWIDPVQDKSVEYYDSFARAPPPSLMKDIKVLVNKINPDVFLKFKSNHVVQQSANSGNCGQFSARFLMDRMRGKSFSDATGYDEKMKMHAVAKNEAEIEKLKKSPPFVYLE